MDFEACLEAFYRQLPFNGCVAIDVGAHNGRHAIPLSEQAGSSGIVHAFEPLPSMRTILARNLESAKANNVVVHPFALAAEMGAVEFHHMPDLPQESGIKARQIYGTAAGAPELISLYAHKLDDVLPGVAPAFIKIDIEGGELDMLNGATKILQAARPIVAFECGVSAFLGYHDRPEDIFRLFDNLGCAVFSILGDRISDAEAFRKATYAESVWDYVALPLDKIHFASFLGVHATASLEEGHSAASKIDRVVGS